MRLLALDAALGPCSVALLEDGKCLGMQRGSDSRAATARLPGMVQDLLAAHGPGFDAVAVTVGPGSFTGIRGALALAHGLAIGAAVPVVGVTVPEAFLAEFDVSSLVPWVALDTRRANRVFLYRGGPVEVLPLASIPIPVRPVIVLGDAAGLVVAALRQAGVDRATAGTDIVNAEAVGRVALRRLAGEVAACAAQPLYIEPPEARAAGSLRPAPA